MANVLDFNMIVDINQILKNKGIEYSIHALGGCSCSGVELRQNGKEYPLDDIVQLINDYLSSKWLKIKQQEENEFLFKVESKFNY